MVQYKGNQERLKIVRVLECENHEKTSKDFQKRLDKPEILWYNKKGDGKDNAPVLPKKIKKGLDKRQEICYNKTNKGKQPLKKQKGSFSMNNSTNMSIDFYNARNAYKMAEQAYKAQKTVVKQELVSVLPTCGDGMTAAELSKTCGIESRDIANILSDYSHSKKLVSTVYVRVNDDGTIDYEHKITKNHWVNVYRR